MMKSNKPYKKKLAMIFVRTFIGDYIK